MGLASPSDRCNGPRSIVAVPAFSAIASVTKPRAVVPVTANASDVPGAPVPVIARVPQDCATAAPVMVRNVARKRVRMGSKWWRSEEWGSLWLEPRGRAPWEQRPADFFVRHELPDELSDSGDAGDRAPMPGNRTPNLAVARLPALPRTQPPCLRTPPLRSTVNSTR